MFYKNDAPFNTLHYAHSNAHKANTIEDFTSQLRNDSKTIAKKV